MISFSCNEIKNEPIMDVHQVFSTYEDIFNSSYASIQPNSFLSAESIDDKNTLVTLHKMNLSTQVENYLKANYFKDINYEIGYYDFQKFQFGGANLKTDALINFDEVSTLTTKQKILTEPFINDILGIWKLNMVQARVYTFVEDVMVSDLTDEEKGELTVLAAATSSVVTFMQNDGVNILYNFMTTLVDDTSTGRIEGDCDVDWRSVWGSAVLGFFGGGTSGAIYGGSGGTIILPGIGSATGFIGGAVFGAAGGFTSGALYGIASELLLSCFRNGGAESCLENGSATSDGPVAECHVVEKT